MLEVVRCFDLFAVVSGVVFTRMFGAICVHFLCPSVSFDNPVRPRGHPKGAKPKTVRKNQFMILRGLPRLTMGNPEIQAIGSWARQSRYLGLGA